MKTKITALLIFFCSIFTFAQTENTLKSIPEFSFVKMQSEGIFSSKDIKKGKQTLIVLYSPTCIHCQLALNHFSNNYEEHLKNNQIILVSEYEAKDAIPFLKEHASNFVNNKNVELLYDSNYEFGPIFQPTSIPTFYLFDKDKSLVTIKKGSVEANQIFKYLK
ncbi:thioredoxin fold domain-containing protein [Empedobacter sp. R132-2]|uniref:TlpA family protein disulfide reductase n=1 Tax=Empedobacter sp. R132-2 TaxID=2746740 RepID=UPI0025769517|nr:thioredoxin fold domain-containing protein [Empedobacter sp. R132-2]MDM1138622.1 thioredoxin fold domain-containing protein [Empedobacter sp. R132-2]